MDMVQAWRAFFTEWPTGLPHRGVLVTAYGEQVVFVEFLTTDALLLVERQTPDAMGGRKVILPYAKVDAVKVVDTVGLKVFTAAGFKEAAGTS